MLPKKEGGGDGIWEALCYFEVNMRPDQWMQSQMHPLNDLAIKESPEYSWFGIKNERGYRNTYRVLTRMGKVLQDRETVYEGVGGFLGNDTYITAAVSADHPSYPQGSNPKATRATLNECGQLFLPVYDDNGSAHKTIVVRYNSVDLNLPKVVNRFAQKAILNQSAKAIMVGPFEQKVYVEKALAEYKPKLEEGLTWRGQLFDIMADCASVLKYLHQSRYYSEKANKYMECIIHRDLKPENMLLTKAFDLKLADFGEARASEEKKTMSVVGTPLYVAPEVLRNDKYDRTVDVYR